MQFGKIASILAGLAMIAGAARAAPVASPPPAAATADAAHDLNRADLEAWLDGRVPYALKSGDIAGAVVVVVKDGKVLLEKGYGYSDVASRTPMDPLTTMVRPGSTSKLFTWTAVMQLVQSGKLDLDRDVNAYLDFRISEPFGRKITLRDLMNHRAGFEEGLKDVLAVDPKTLQSTEQYLKRHPRPMLFAPGEVPAYSNYGAALAGYIVQRVSGEPFAQYVERHILLPLQMTRTTFEQPLPDGFTHLAAKGYRTASGAPQPYEFVVTAPAGSAAATADDMSRFMLAHLQHGSYGGAQILDPKTEALMQTPSETGAPGFATMAHGFFHFTQNGRTVIGHGGDTIVFHTEMNLLPDEGVGIFFNFNSRGAEDAVYGARAALFNGFMDRYFPAPPVPSPSTAASAQTDAKAIAGRYWSSRRVEHGFLSLFYMLQQSQIVANPDGTITAPSPGERSDSTFREVAPNLWRQVGGTRELALAEVGGVRTVIDSEDPTSVLQAVPALKSAGLVLPILAGSLIVLLWTLALWALSPLLRRGDRATIALSPHLRRARLVLRIAAAVDMAYLVAWYMLLTPILSSQVEVYGTPLDPVVAALEGAGLLVVGAGGAGLWAAWRTVTADTTWLVRIWSGLAAAAMLGIVWVGLAGQLISFNLNY